MALNGLICAEVPLRNYSLTHSVYYFYYYFFCPPAQSRGREN